jgi:hypothetical protein
MCHYIDRDCSFASYVNKKQARNRSLCRLALPNNARQLTIDLSLGGGNVEKILFPLFRRDA